MPVASQSRGLNWLSRKASQCGSKQQQRSPDEITVIAC